MFLNSPKSEKMGRKMFLFWDPTSWVGFSIWDLIGIKLESRTQLVSVGRMVLIHEKQKQM